MRAEELLGDEEGLHDDELSHQELVDGVGVATAVAGVVPPVWSG